LEPPKNPGPFGYELATYLWVIGLSALGGIVSWIRKVREGNARVFNIAELVGEIFTAGFAGLITFWLCEAADMNELVQAALIGIAGHMGSRAVFLFEKWAEARIPQPPAPPPQP
jgi:hypothetical protein